MTSTRKKTRKERFLEDMERIIPCKELLAVIEPFYPKPEGAGRRPIEVERMLRIHFLQHWFNLSDPAAEEALYDSRTMRRFGFTKVRCQGLAKNGHRLVVACALGNLVMAKKVLLKRRRLRPQVACT